jgi:hypothetical protein
MRTDGKRHPSWDRSVFELAELPTIPLGSICMGNLRSIWVEFFLFHRSCAGVKTPIPESSHPLLAIDEESSTAREYASFVTSFE